MATDTPITVEFAVAMTCSSCGERVTAALHAINEHEFTINEPEQRVVVTSSRSVVEVARALETTGMKVRIRGYGNAGGENLGAAVVEFRTEPVLGVLRLIQIAQDRLVIEGTVDGLSPGLHAVHIHEYGDLRDNGANIGGHYNPDRTPHGSPSNAREHRHLGDLGNMEVDASGRGIIRLEDRYLNVWNLIGRAVSIKERADSFDPTSPDGDAGASVAIALVARSSGLFENNKTLCLCSGKTLWEEEQLK